jgi:CIC family chloride channel protein
VGCALLGGMIVMVPALFGEGYTSIKALALVNPAELFLVSPMQSAIVNTDWGLGVAVLFVGLIKAFAVSMTLGAGGNGGNFAPALLVGACLGFSFSFLLNSTGLTHLPTANFCLVAMAGVLTGIFHAPLTGVFLIAEITGGYDLIIPLMLVSALSTAVSRYLHPRSLDEEKLASSHRAISFDKDAHVLSSLSLAGFIEHDFAVVRANASLRKLVDAVAHSKRNIFPVTDEQNNLVGIIGLEDVREIMFDNSLYDSVSVDQLMQKPRVTASLADDMASVMEKFDKSGVWNIPVVDNGRYVGFISKSRVFSNYREKLRSD